MSRSEQIPAPIPDKFKPLTEVKRGDHTTHLPRKYAEVNAALARRASLKKTPVQGK